MDGVGGFRNFLNKLPGLVLCSRLIASDGEHHVEVNLQSLFRTGIGIIDLDFHKAFLFRFSGKRRIYRVSLVVKNASEASEKPFYLRLREMVFCWLMGVP